MYVSGRVALYLPTSTQALYDGKALVLQYSLLFNFADAVTASMESSVRCRLSEPIGGDTHTLSIR